MKVSLACQVFSHSVAAGILAKIANNELPQETTTTAMLIEKMDQLFDTLNGDTPDRKRGKKYFTNFTQRSPSTFKLF
ncbi:unnamed protein product [Euphydryas editha]|uniref:Transposable element P transposase-like GTP-binding insertion domain-containing protein n=1 Tax=Euphydryas editha TaxID=104508 RepID=A0AAU9TRG9_EUPED|nr:unnamed protein product [Euphydryas editha]